MRVVIEELKDLKSNKIYAEYQIAFNEFLNHLYKENKKNPKGFLKDIKKK
jgi:hypothetical protein